MLTTNNQSSYCANPFNTNLARLRKKAGLTQKELAEKLKVNRAWVGQLETDSSVNPSMKTVKMIAEALGCKPSDLME